MGNFYEKYASQFAAETVDLDVSFNRDRFLGHLRKGASILDIGCGSGRDLLSFKDQGFDAVGIEPSHALSKLASEYSGCTVDCCTIQDYKQTREFDGVWACASLLHVNSSELGGALLALGRCLKVGGVAYLSFKHGDFEGMVGERYFTNLTELTLPHYLPRNLKLKELWITDDARLERSNLWLNALVTRIY